MLVIKFVIVDEVTRTKAALIGACALPVLTIWCFPLRWLATDEVDGFLKIKPQVLHTAALPSSSRAAWFHTQLRLARCLTSFFAELFVGELFVGELLLLGVPSLVVELSPAKSTPSAVVRGGFCWEKV